MTIHPNHPEPAMNRLRVLSITTCLLACAPAGAITYGTADEGRHPEVGAVVGTFSSGTFPYCSGTLIAPDVFLTAAHCDIGRTRVFVTFDEHADGSSTLLPGTFVPNPEYTQRQNDPHDLAVILLDTPVAGITPAQLPTLGQFENVAKDQKFTAVGYGGQERVIDHGPVIDFLDSREFSVQEFNSVGPGYLRLSQNNAKGDAGACYGDSGGPNFLGAGSGETDVIAGTTITGDAQCVATNVIERLDTVASRRFLGNFVVLP